MIDYTLRHMIRHWRLNLVLLLGITLTVGLPAGLPSYARAIAGRTLTAELEAAPAAGRNIEIRGQQSILIPSFFATVDSTLGDLLSMRLEVHSFEMEVTSEPVRAVDSGSRLEPQLVNVWAIDRPREVLQLVEGEWPTYEAPHTPEEIRQAMFQTPTLEAAIASQVAKQSGLKLGDMVYAGGDYSFRIVGILQPLDASSDVWWGDQSLFELGVLPGRNEDTITLPLFIYMQGMRELLPFHDYSWRVVIDQSKVLPEDVEAIESQMINLKTVVSSAGAHMLSDLPNLLLAYRQNLSTIRMVLLLLGAQAYLFVLYALYLLTSTGLERLQSEMAVLVGRGASTWQIVQPFMIEGLAMALLAGGVLGPWGAQTLLSLWSLWSGASIPARLPLDSLQLAWLGAGCGWLAICAAALPAARRSVLEWQQYRGRPRQWTGWQSLSLDLVLFLVGSLAYWQLSNRGSFVVSRLHQTDLADPLLLLGPSLLLLGLALIGLRSFPYLLRGLAWIARGGRGLVLQMGLNRLARDPRRPAQVILLISLTTGLTFFSINYLHSLELAQMEVAHYRAGADLRLHQAGEPLESFASLEGVRGVTSVFREAAQTASGRDLVLLGIDPATFSLVARYPPGLTDITTLQVSQVVHWEALADPGDVAINPYIDAINKSDPFAAIFSASALEATQEVGDEVQLALIPYHISIQVKGVLVNFPTISGSFLIVDQEALEHYLDLEMPVYYSSHEVWLEIDPAAYPALIEDPLVKDNLLADARTEKQRLERNAFIQGLRYSFDLNTTILTILSVSGLFLVHYFSAQQRTYEFGILRSNGLSAGQIWLLLAGEACILVLVGLLMGTGVGIGLTQIMRVYLNLLLDRVEPGLAVYQIQVDWGAVITQYGWLILFYLLSVVFSLIMLLRAGVHRVLRLGDE